MTGIDESVLRTAAQAGPAAHFVVLFGSQARGSARPDSDIDIAWLPVDPDLPLRDELSFQALLTRLLQRDVDLVRVDRTSTVCRHAIAREGRLLAGDPGSFHRFRADAVLEYLDFAPALQDAAQRYHRFLARASGAARP